MDKKEAISFIHKFIKQADVEQIRNLICAIYPRCSDDCPLRNKHKIECDKIEDD